MMVSERNGCRKKGTVTLGEQDGEGQVREKIASSLKERYIIIGPNDFEFAKNQCPASKQTNRVQLRCSEEIG